MLDVWTLKLIKPPLVATAKQLKQRGVSANQVTVVGFALGMLAIPTLAFEYYYWALGFILANRISDGIDGALARETHPTDSGGYLDIVFDFIFYSGVVLGFALANPAENAIAACVLVFAFMGTGSSFLAYAIMAERHQIKSLDYPSKGFYYLGGLTEGTETIALYILFCLLPNFFPHLAYGFAALCFITTFTRVIGGYHTLKQLEAN